ncbi:hypothetical protein [Paenibacillus alvei]|uniref:hypothetical protein n=1 Tax=Paenibacillus alvei TaxID=44250 RepID=UPI0013DB4360|nr:hypothetical protein [Paenibacillus alvei]NEZ45464.1 hypothetical protein [Paenibacillus alvei]
MANLDLAKAALDSFCDGLAQGNEGHADVEEFSLEGTTLHFKVAIVHKETKKIPLVGKVTIYSVTTHVKGDIDVTNPRPKDIDLCVDTPVGKICGNSDSLINVLTPFLT